MVSQKDAPHRKVKFCLGIIYFPLWREWGDSLSDTARFRVLILQSVLVGNWIGVFGTRRKKVGAKMKPPISPSSRVRNLSHFQIKALG